MSNVASLSAARVRRTNSPKDWKLIDMLRDLLRRVESGELPADAPAVLVLQKTLKDDQVSMLTFSAGVESIDEAASVLARGIRGL